MENGTFEVMSPLQFDYEVRRIVRDFHGDPETMHKAFDVLCGNLLRSLGYSEGMDEIEDEEFWYA